jgi:preprotein translocase subunit YajC
VFISDAFAAPAAGAQDPILGLLPFIVIFVLFYFMLIRPQMKRAKEQKKMVDALHPSAEANRANAIAQGHRKKCRVKPSNRNPEPLLS